VESVLGKIKKKSQPFENRRPRRKAPEKTPAAMARGVGEKEKGVERYGPKKKGTGDMAEDSPPQEKQEEIVDFPRGKRRRGAAHNRPRKGPPARRSEGAIPPGLPARIPEKKGGGSTQPRRIPGETGQKKG